MLFNRFIYLLQARVKIFVYYGLFTCIKKIFLATLRILIFPLLLPFAIFLRLLGYQVLNIFTDRIGHLAIEPDCLIKDLILKKYTIKKIIFLAPTRRVSNKHLLMYWKNFFIIVENPLICFLLNSIAFSFFAKLDASKYARSNFSPHAAYRVYREWSNRPPLLRLKTDDLEWGRKILRNIGIPANAWFVCVHIRDVNFSKIDSFLHSHRNGDHKNLVLAIEEIINRGGWVIRIGSGDSILVDLIKSKKYIDYPSSQFVSDRMDIFLCAQAKFILGNTSGIAIVGSIFGTPCALVNMTPISATGFNSMDISFPKLHWHLSKKRYINLQEIYDLGLLDARTAFAYEKAKVKLIENSPEDIRDLCIEMFLNLEYPNMKNENLLTANQIFNDFPESRVYSKDSIGKFSSALVNKYKYIFNYYDNSKS